MRNTLKTALVALTVVAGACGDGGTSPVSLPGTWTLISVDGTPVPNAVAISGHITFGDGATYGAQTCYGTGAPPCQVARNEVGDFSIAGNVITLTAGAYVRSLTRSGQTLTQSGGGDTGNAVLVYTK